MRIPFLGTVVDERVLNYRLRSSSISGIAGALIAIAIFEYKLFAQHIWSWDLLCVVGAMVVVKLSLMAWFLIRA
jgi:hypothetical protein